MSFKISILHTVYFIRLGAVLTECKDSHKGTGSEEQRAAGDEGWRQAVFSLATGWSRRYHVVGIAWLQDVTCGVRNRGVGITTATGYNRRCV